MTTILVTLSLALCLALFIDLMAISPNRLDAIGLRAELMVWLMFSIFAFYLGATDISPSEGIFFILLILTRLIVCVSYALGHPYQAKKPDPHDGLDETAHSA